MTGFLHTHWRNTVYSNLWIALGAGLWVWAACEAFDANGLLPGVFTASATVFVYNFQRLVKLSDRPNVIVPGRNEWLYQNRFWMLMWVFAGLGGVVFTALQIAFHQLAILMLPCALALAYVFRIIPGKPRPQALREIPGLKIFLIAFTWSVVCGVFPASFAHDPGAGIMLFAFERFFFILAITVPFDVRDLRYDDSRMRTIPQILGVQKSLRFAQISLVLSGLMAVWCWFIGFTDVWFMIASLLALIPAAWLIHATEPDKPELFYTGKLDGLIAFQAILQALSALL